MAKRWITEGRLHLVCIVPFIVAALGLFLALLIGLDRLLRPISFGDAEVTEAVMRSIIFIVAVFVAAFGVRWAYRHLIRFLMRRLTLEPSLGADDRASMTCLFWSMPGLVATVAVADMVKTAAPTRVWPEDFTNIFIIATLFAGVFTIFSFIALYLPREDQPRVSPQRGYLGRMWGGTRTVGAR